MLVGNIVRSRRRRAPLLVRHQLILRLTQTIPIIRQVMLRLIRIISLTRPGTLKRIHTILLSLRQVTPSIP
jgi:hypothetical protein